ncbi:hypothetical protein [Streptococcus iniae]|uniref:hypothetical protein n=1 Tax=Streptococcus iniae TaxID=1346 RepID=UPI00273D6B14|nr:hypothetical protein [Streptococcus iniae]WLR87998.1 hypothetical protein Q9317_01380 [Streptococcus iniae]WLR89943.1 hypothetical protein Q9318_01450 [Streptococcus iniae]
MKFLTEDDLRLKYNAFPFETFTIENNTRLTPGAKTFLMDRKVTIYDDNDPLWQKKKAMTVKRKSNTQNAKSKGFRHLPEQAEWFAIRCEFLKTASDLAHLDLVLAKELGVLENCLALSLVGEKQSPPQLKLEKPLKEIDKTYIITNLSTVSMFLELDKGKILTRLYPLYFRLEAFIEQLSDTESDQFKLVSERLEELIAYYLNKSEEESYHA